MNININFSERELLELLAELNPVSDGKNITCNCPACGKREFGVKLSEHHLFNCYRKKKCGITGNIFSLLRFINKQSIIYNKEEKDNKTFGEIKLKKKEKKQLDFFLPDIELPIGFKKVKHHFYLEQRGFIYYDKYNPGITKLESKYDNGYIIFPIYQDNGLKATIGRSFLSKEDIEKKENDGIRILRYINSSSDFGKLLLGIEDIKDNTNTIILVEGIFDKFNVDKVLNLENSDDIKCICTFGAKISDEQLYRLIEKSNIETIILLFDNDVIDKIKSSSFKLEPFFDVLIGFSKYGDPGEMNLKQFKETFRKLESPTMFSINKINKKILR